MSKSKNRKWYDSYDADYDDDYQDKKKNNDRRKQKRMKNALRTKNYEYFNDDER